MAEEMHGSGTAAHGNEWEVLSLTASAYAAAPGPKVVEQDIEEESNVSSKLEGESSDALFMSRHFANPETENFVPEGDKRHTQKMNEDKAELVEEVCEVNKQSIESSAMETSKNILASSTIEKEINLYGMTPYSSFYSDAPADENVDCPDLTKTSERGTDVDEDGSEVFMQNKKSPDESNPPCEAWWKRRAAILYAQAKETNTLWPIVIAAAVMGLVFLGHRWRRERRQILQIKWHVDVKDENSGRVLQPISLLKNVIVGGSRVNSSQGAHYGL